MKKPSRLFILAALFFIVVLPIIFTQFSRQDLGWLQPVALILYVAPAVLFLIPFALVGWVNYENNYFFEGFVKLFPIFPQGYMLCSACWIGLLVMLRFLFRKCTKHATKSLAEQAAPSNR
jgi:hypothetical protein